MYTGKNPSALRSREWLRSAMLELLKENTYSHITIKDICNQADLSRQTFYQIFSSKEEIMEYHFMLLFEEFSEEYGNIDDSSVGKIAFHFFNFFYQKKAFINILIQNNMTYLLEEQFEKYLNQIELFHNINVNEKYPDYSRAYIAGALTQILIHWFKCHCNLKIDELSKLTEAIITGRVMQ